MKRIWKVRDSSAQDHLFIKPDRSTPAGNVFNNLWIDHVFDEVVKEFLEGGQVIATLRVLMTTYPKDKTLRVAQKGVTAHPTGKRFLTGGNTFPIR